MPEVDRFAGDDVRVKLELVHRRGVLPTTFVLRERIGKLGERETPLPMRRGTSYLLQDVPRGRYVFEENTLVIEDPLGLDRIEEPLDGSGRAARLPAARRPRPPVLGDGHDGA